MFLANEEEIMNQAKQRITTVRTIGKRISFKATRDIKKGEPFYYDVEIQVPVDIQDKVWKKEGFLGR